MQLQQKCYNEKKMNRLGKFLNIASKQNINSKYNVKGTLPVKDKRYLHVKHSCMRVTLINPNLKMAQFYVFHHARSHHN